MRRIDRNNLIETSTDLMPAEKPIAVNISSVIGDSEYVDIDWDDLQEATGISDIGLLETLIDTLYDLDILKVLNYQEGVMG